MVITSIGDMASSMILRTRGASLRSDMDRLLQGLSSGQVKASETSDGGSFRAVSGLQQTLVRLGAYESAAIEAGGMAAMQQTSLNTIQSSASRLSGGILSASYTGQVAGVQLRAAEAADGFAAAVTALNASFAGRYVFSGVASDQPAVVQADAMIGDLVAAVSGETTAAGVASVVDTWFDSGGGFDTGAYRGGSALAPTAVAQGRSVSLDTTAASTEIRDALKGFALGVLVDKPPLQNAPDEQLELARLAGETLIAGSDGLIDLSARLGLAEEQIEDARTEIASETTSTNLALAERTTADPFAYASELQQLETQLEMLYSLTARASRLKLSDYL